MVITQSKILIYLVDKTNYSIEVKLSKQYGLQVCFKPGDAEPSTHCHLAWNPPSATLKLWLPYHTSVSEHAYFSVLVVNICQEFMHA